MNSDGSQPRMISGAIPDTWKPGSRADGLPQALSSKVARPRHRPVYAPSTGRLTTWPRIDRVFRFMPLHPLSRSSLAKATRPEEVEGGCSICAFAILLIQVRFHLSNDFTVVVVVTAIDLLGKQRQELVVASLADPNVRPWITVGVLALPVFHHDDAGHSAHVSTGCLCTLRWVESGADQLLKQHRNCRLPGWGIGLTLNALYRFGVARSRRPFPMLVHGR